MNEQLNAFRPNIYCGTTGVFRINLKLFHKRVDFNIFIYIYLGEKLELLFNESHNSPMDFDARSFPGDAIYAE